MQPKPRPTRRNHDGIGPIIKVVVEIEAFAFAGRPPPLEVENQPLSSDRWIYLRPEFVIPRAELTSREDPPSLESLHPFGRI